MLATVTIIFFSHTKSAPLRETPFAVCQGHTVKPQKPTANPLPCAAHGKAHTTTRDRQSRSLPCAIYRAHGKGFAVCNYRPPAKKKSPPRNDDMAGPLPCACRRGTRQSSNICRVPWFLHTAKVPDPVFSFCLLRIWYPQIIQTVHIYHNNHRMQSK